MAEARPPDVAAIHAQRAEVNALLAFRAAKPEAQAAAWWRLQAARRARLALLPPEQARALRPLPAPPRDALTAWQALRLRLGLLRWQDAATPARFAAAQPTQARR